MPIAIEKNKYINSSGSLIGVRNLTIESAPINPRDKAKEDFTIKIIRNVTKDKVGIIELMWCLLDIETDFALNKYFNINEENIQHIKLTNINT